MQEKGEACAKHSSFSNGSETSPTAVKRIVDNRYVSRLRSFGGPARINRAFYRRVF